MKLYYYVYFRSFDDMLCQVYNDSISKKIILNALNIELSLRFWVFIQHVVEMGTS